MVFMGLMNDLLERIERLSRALGAAEMREARAIDVVDAATNKEYAVRKQLEAALRDLEAEKEAHLYTRGQLAEARRVNQTVTLASTPATPVPETVFPIEFSDDQLYAVFLEGFNDKAKIPAVKLVRSVTDLGLKEAKDFVEGVLPKRIGVFTAARVRELIKYEGVQLRIHTARDTSYRVKFTVHGSHNPGELVNALVRDGFYHPETATVLVDNSTSDWVDLGVLAATTAARLGVELFSYGAKVRIFAVG
jgi:ribosomal protein L7/L12